MRRYISFLFLLIGLNATAQSLVTINGPAVILPTLTYQYTVSYNNHLQLPLSFTWSVSGGTIVAQNGNPAAGPVYANIIWDNTTADNVSVLETVNNIFTRLNVSVTNVNDICDDITPEEQAVNYLQTPQQLSLVDCGIPLNFPYTVTYQWQYVHYNDPTEQRDRDPDQMAWVDINGATSVAYQPPQFTQYGVDFYRRVTKLYNGSGNLYRTYKSKLSVVRLGYLDAGTICNALPGFVCPDPGIDITIPYGSPILVSQTPGSGGLCTDRDYTWQVSKENMAWEDIGIGIDFPAGYIIIGNVRVRRKVTCGTDVKYTNELKFKPSYVSPNLEALNYVRKVKVLKPGVLNWIQADQLDHKGRVQTTTYLDGNGRSVQHVAKETQMNAAGDLLDAVSFNELDEYWRPVKQYLPYVTQTNLGFFKTDPATEQQTFIRNKYGEAPGSPTWSTTTFDESPLERVLNVKEAGTSWGGDPNYAGASIDEDVNNANEAIKIFTIGDQPSDVPFWGSDVYPAGKLSKTTFTDDKGKLVIQYADFQGRVIAKKVQLENSFDPEGYQGWLVTYYVYDAMGMQRAILTPRAMKYMLDHNAQSLPADVYKELCYYHYYDERGRVIVKHSPGAGEITYVYDQNDRMVLSQDENQRTRTNMQWNFYLYDELGRAKVTGLFDRNISGTTYAVRNTMQAFVNSLNNGMQDITIFTGANETVRVDNPVAGTYAFCNSCSNVIINSVGYFDDYNYPGAKTFSTNFSFSAVPENTYDIEPSDVCMNTRSKATGKKQRVLDAGFDDGNAANDVFLTSTAFYDYRGRVLQAHQENISGATDITTNQYSYDGGTVSTCSKHSFTGAATNSFTTISKYDRDLMGRVSKISHNYNGSATRAIVSFTYDEMGRMKTRKQSPDYNGGSGIETYNYDFNIKGSLAGINKDYALSGSILSQWDHYFGIYLGYDNRDNKFAGKQLNGNLTGVLWRTQGDNMPRRYDYEYDNMGRFTKAAFLQKENPLETTWSNTKMDFTVSNITYDENNNLKTMNQRGVLPGMNSPVYVDKLQYTYNPVGGSDWSNKLQKVFDATTDLGAAENGKTGDFKDEQYGVNNNDYEYDGNGNLVKDHNKKIRNSSANGIVYNYMDKPQKIYMENKSVIEFTYLDDGTKLSKKTTQIQSGVSTTLWYAGRFIYEEKSGVAGKQLNSILHEEGRIKVFKLNTVAGVTRGNYFDMFAPDIKGVFEFFVRDHLQNTRMVLTEETYQESHECKMEAADHIYEEAMFSGSANEVLATRVDQSSIPGIATNPWAGNSDPNSVKVSQVGQGNKVGPNILFKIMAGDHVTVSVDYLYRSGSASGTGTQFTTAVLNSLLGALGASPQTGPVKGFSNNINTTLGGASSALNTYLQPQTTSGTNTPPQAYLNILFFDENFNLVPKNSITGLGSQSFRVSVPDGHKINVPNIKAPKNGYVFVYVSNNEDNQYVYFDNLRFTHNRGAIVEENHYYAYGLKIKGLSARAYDAGGTRVNPYNYQGSFSEEDEETGWNEFALRMYDPQRGVWTGIDPFDQFASPFTGMGANPVNLVDPSGGDVWSWLTNDLFSGSNPLGKFIGFGVGLLSRALSSNFDFNEAMSGAFTGMAMGSGIQSGDIDPGTIGEFAANVIYSEVGVDINEQDYWYVECSDPCPSILGKRQKVLPTNLGGTTVISEYVTESYESQTTYTFKQAVQQALAKMKFEVAAIKGPNGKWALSSPPLYQSVNALVGDLGGHNIGINASVFLPMVNGTPTTEAEMTIDIKLSRFTEEKTTISFGVSHPGTGIGASVDVPLDFSSESEGAFRIRATVKVVTSKNNTPQIEVSNIRVDFSNFNGLKVYESNAYADRTFIPLEDFRIEIKLDGKVIKYAAPAN